MGFLPGFLNLAAYLGNDEDQGHDNRRDHVEKTERNPPGRISTYCACASAYTIYNEGSSLVPV